MKSKPDNAVIEMLFHEPFEVSAGQFELLFKSRRELAEKIVDHGKYYSNVDSIEVLLSRVFKNTNRLKLITPKLKTAIIAATLSKVVQSQKELAFMTLYSNFELLHFNNNLPSARVLLEESLSFTQSLNRAKKIVIMGCDFTKITSNDSLYGSLFETFFKCIRNKSIKIIIFFDNKKAINYFKNILLEYLVKEHNYKSNAATNLIKVSIQLENISILNYPRKFIPVPFFYFEDIWGLINRDRLLFSFTQSNYNTFIQYSDLETDIWHKNFFNQLLNLSLNKK